MGLRKNPASDWKLYPVPNSRAKVNVGTRIWNGVYCIIDKGLSVKKLFRDGADIVQIRFKNAPSYKLVGIAKELGRIARAKKKALLINDRPDVALAAAATGVHLGSGDFPVTTARRLIGNTMVIGRTVHSVKEAKKLRRAAINYMSAGPIFSTPIKKNLKPRGAGFIKNIKKHVSVPLFAIGGINRFNAREVFENGADGVCVTRAAKDAAGLTREIAIWGLSK
jgi:thiamine-phosphate pyrophosphorylase